MKRIFAAMALSLAVAFSVAFEVVTSPPPPPPPDTFEWGTPAVSVQVR